MKHKEPPRRPRLRGTAAALINAKAWEFLKAHVLPADAKYKEHQFKFKYQFKFK